MQIVGLVHEAMERRLAMPGHGCTGHAQNTLERSLWPVLALPAARGPKGWPKHTALTSR